MNPVKKVYYLLPGVMSPAKEYELPGIMNPEKVN